MAVALTLSNVAKRMRDVSILPKSLAVVETLGFVNVICSDKTGTLTENKVSRWVIVLILDDSRIVVNRRQSNSPQPSEHRF